MKTEMTRSVAHILSVVVDKSFEIDDLSIKEALEDGEALSMMGFTDEDQDAIEEAHAYLTELIKNNIPLISMTF